jgi:hypothetical protein
MIIWKLRFMIHLVISFEKSRLFEK